MVARLAISFLVIATFTTAVQDAFGQSSANVLLVVNESSPVSLEIGNYYAQKRNVPAANIVHLQLQPSESIERADYERQVETPIRSWLLTNFAEDRILYIVLTKGIPLRINGTSGQDGTVASVDSELTLLYRKLTGVAVPVAGRINNPYFLGESSSRTKNFTHESFDIFLVTRLDGYTVADVRALIDRGLAPAKEGTIILDDKASSASDANPWLKSASESLKNAGDKNRVIYDTTATVVKNVNGVLGYYSWGSNDPAIHDRHFDLKFVNGALAAMYVSTDGRTFNEPPADWKIGRPDDSTTFFEGSPQSLMGDFIRDGITGVAGHVTEPYLDASIRPNILFPAYLSGANLAEAFYQAMPYLSWQTIVVGDPLCAPFRSTALTATEIDKGPDTATEFPQFFSNWHLKVLSSPAVNPGGVDVEVLKLLMRADARGFKKDVPAVRQLLEEATARDKRLISATLNLALLYESIGEYDKSIERYRTVLAAEPTNVIVLNNLAFALAVRKNSPQEALPLAEKAYSLVPRNPSLSDTLGWIVHLAGNDRRAAGLLAEATQLAPQNPAIHLHAAIVHAALNEDDEAKQELTKALQLDAKLATDAQVQQLRTKLKMPE